MISSYLFYLHQICSQHQISVRRRFRESWKAIRSTHPKFPITADPRNVLPVPCVLLFPRLGRANLREGIDFGMLRFVGRSIVSRHVHSATGPIADDSRKSTQRQTSGRVVSSRFSLPLRDERSRTNNRKKNRFAEQSLLPWRVFQPFDPPSRALPTSKELLFAVDFVRVNGTRVFDRLFIFPKVCQKCKDYSYISFDAFQTWIKRWCRWYLLGKRFRQSRQ